MKKFLQFYHAANRHRRNWFHWPFRLSMMALACAVLLFAYIYLESNYYCLVGEGQCEITGTFLSDLLFNWFMIGAFFGFLVFAALAEGEFMLGIRKIARALEVDVEEVEEIEKKMEREGSRRSRAAKPKNRRARGFL